MASRPYWSGHLRMSLVQFGIQLYPAVNPQAGIAFHEIHRETGQRIHHLNVVGQNRPVDNTDIVKGYEYRKGKYLVVEPEEIGNLRIESKNVIDISQFVDFLRFASRSLRKALFCGPAAEGARGRILCRSKGNAGFWQSGDRRDRFWRKRTFDRDRCAGGSI